MEMLRTLVEAGTRREAAPTASGGTSSSEDKVKAFEADRAVETDDIEAYPTTFERMMAAYEVPENRWPYKLAPMLTGKARQAYAATGDFGHCCRGQRSDLDHFNPVFTGFCTSRVLVLYTYCSGVTKEPRSMHVH